MKDVPNEKNEGEKSQRPLAEFLFLIVVIALYGLLSLIEPGKTGHAFSFGLKVLAKLWPILIFVFFLMFVINLLVKPSWIKSHVGHDSGAKGVGAALLGGIISLGPIYIWYALLRDFQKKGMRPALIAVFLYGRSIKIPLLPLMAFYFGITYTIILTLYMVLFSVLSGLFTEWLIQRRSG